MQLKNRHLKKKMVTGLWELKKTINSKHKSWKSSQLRVESESESEVAQLCPTLCDPVDCSSSVHAILQARILERVAISFSIFICVDIDWIDLTCWGNSIFILQSHDNENTVSSLKVSWEHTVLWTQWGEWVKHPWLFSPMEILSDQQTQAIHCKDESCLTLWDPLCPK